MSEYLGPYKLGPFDTESWGIYTGDARELSEAIPDESVDLIFTDPVYDRIEDYEWLAQTAARVLKPDRACLTWCGIGYLPETLDAIRAGGLSYRWMFIMYYSNQVRPSRVPAGFSKYANLMWLEKGKMKARRGIDLLPVPVFEGMHGRRINHRWSKPPRFYKYIIELFPGSIIFDPFTGGGTVPTVAKMLGRRWFAFEIDPDTAELARRRVAQTQPPLEMPMPEQLALDLNHTERT